MRTVQRDVTVLALVVCWLVATAGPGWAHASFVTSHPEPGADLAAAPGVVTLRFSEPLIEDLSRVTVTDPTGERFTAGPTGEREIRVDVNSTAQGGYTVDWRTVSPIDGHTLHGAFEFGVGAQVAHQDAPSDTPAAGDMLVAMARAVEYAGLLGALGLLSLAGLAKQDGLPWAPQGLQRWAVVAAAGGTLTITGELLLAASGSPFTVAASSFLLAPSGIPRLGRLLTELTAAAITLRAARRAGTGAVAQRSIRAWATLLTLVTLALLSAAGHAAAWGTSGILADVGHLWAAGIWAGGLIVMAFHRPPGGWQGEAGRQLIRRFSPLALTMFSGTVLFGSVRTWQELAHLSDLWTTSYGEVLTVKIVFVVVMLPLSRLAWRRERPHLRAEGLLAVGVLLAAAALAAFPSPPGRADESAAADAGQEEPDLPIDGDLTMAEGAGTTVVGISIRPAEPGINDVYAHLIPVSGADMAEPLDARIAIDGDEQEPMRRCATACRVATVPLDGGERVDITVSGADGGTATFALPELPAPDGSDLASRLTSRMRQVDSLRYDEVFGPHAPPTTSTWEIVAPDRLHGLITGGADFYETIRIRDRRWRRDTPDGAWQGGEPGGITVRANRFIWDYDDKTAAGIIGTGTVDGVETRIVSFYLRQGALSSWYRLWVDNDDKVRQAEMRAQGHFMDHHYYDFNEDIDIRPPG